VLYEGLQCAAAQLVFDATQSRWRRAYVVGAPLTKNTLPLYSVVTEHCKTLQVRGKGGRDVFVRDYREVPLPDMERPYAEAFIASRDIEFR
jgi:hypothetical protein